MKKIILFGLTVALLTSCASTEKLMERGNYEELITKATRKLAGKKKNDHLVLALEEGYKKLSVEVMTRIENYKKVNTAEAWEAVLFIANNIERVQARIDPLLPLVSENGRRARFRFIGTTEIITEAKKSAAALYYTKLNSLANEAYNGNKPAARVAYDIIDRIHRLSLDYDLAKFKSEMYHIGINKIWVTIDERSYTRLPFRLYNEMKNMAIRNDANDWNQYFAEIGEDEAPDYKVVFHINDLSSDRAQHHTTENNYWKEIADGWEYILDSKGNVAKDSLGNDVKRDRKIKVRATVTETNLTKRAYINGYMEVINMKTGNVSYSSPLNFEDWFSHTSRKYSGDARALDNHLGTIVHPVDCPDDIYMMMQVLEKAKRAFVHEIKRVNYL